MKRTNTSILRIALLAICLGVAQKASGSAIDAYLAPPSDQASTETVGATTETFGATAMSTASYTSTIGTFTSASNFSIVAHDQYGGAGAAGDYLAFGAESGHSTPITLTLTTPADYLGVWISAADANNGISFYSGATLVGRFTTSSLLTLLDNTTLTENNGSTETSASYLGNPNNRTQNAGQPYAYVDFIGNGTTISSIVLDNSGTNATGFESDNYTVVDSAVTPPPSDVFITAVPEPSQYGVLLGGLVFCLVAGHRLVKRFRVRAQA